MAGVAWEHLAGVVLFLFSIWIVGRGFRFIYLPAILGEVLTGIILGPNVLDLVPYASDGTCPGLSFSSTPSRRLAAAGSASGSGDAGHGCTGAMWNGEHVMDIWSFIGTVGVTLLITESGMHINFEKVRAIGCKALIVAIIGTLLPAVFGMLLVEVFFPGRMFPDGFAAGCALAPTSVGISIKLLDDAKMLNSMAGQTTLTAAFVDDVFSLILLVLLNSIASGQADPGMIVLRTLLAFAFLGVGVFLAIKVFPRMHKLIDRVPHSRFASLQPKDEVLLLLIFLSLIGFGYVGSLVGSHLLGAFVAGMCFTGVPRAHAVWVSQMKRIVKWTVRVFFAATVGFAIPVQTMLGLPAFARGLAVAVLAGLVGKVVSGLPARLPYESEAAREMATKASKLTFGGRAQPLQYLVGSAMVARGEFAFLVAYSARSLTSADGVTPMMSNDVYAMVTWALGWALICAPFLFRWSLGLYVRAYPVQRASILGGSTLAGRDFIVRVFGHHHTGLLHAVLHCLHSEGLDVVEARVEATKHQLTDEERASEAKSLEKRAAKHSKTLGAAAAKGTSAWTRRGSLGMDDSCVFVVRSRGKQKDFSDEKLMEIKHHLEETLDGKASEVVFEPIAADVQRAERAERARQQLSEKSILSKISPSFKCPKPRTAAGSEAGASAVDQRLACTVDDTTVVASV